MVQNGSDQPGKSQLTDSKSWDRFWDGSKGGKPPSWSKKRICRILGKYIRPGYKVLDAGCGSGFFSNWFLQQGLKTSSLDYSQKALESTKGLTDGKCEAYLSGDLTDPAIYVQYEKLFDLIFSDGLFEHFEEGQQDAIFLNMTKMLKPDGVIVTFVPNLFTPWTLLRPFLMPGIHEKPFTIGSLKNLYERNGSDTKETGGINVLPVAFSPDSLFGSRFGMLVYCVGGLT